MDAIVFITIALVLTLMPEHKVKSATEANLDKVVVEDITREAKLNDSYYEDTNAFSAMINDLGYPK